MDASSDRFLKVKSYIETTANLLLITAIVVGLSTFFRHHEAVHPVAQTSGFSNPSQGNQVGREVRLPGVDWKAHKATLVVAISSACHFCVHSAPFYSALTHSPHSTPVVVVMPQASQDIQAFLSKHDINPAKTISEDLADLQVEGTPTLLLVSSSGAVTQSWVGELTSAQQQQVTDALARS